MIGLSKAYKEGKRIRSTAGLLKTPDGKTVWIDMQNRNMLISLGFHQEKQKTRFTFE